jgi:hypothetical protein
MITPLYKRLKENGTSVYVFPGAAEDISAAYQNTNYKMYFSKYILLNLPSQELVLDPIKFDFDNAFFKSNNATPTPQYSEAIIESLRNYVANNEVVLRESRLNDKRYFYNVNSLETTSEKIFWKWCRKIGILDLEPAIPGEEYFPDLEEFQANDLTDDEFFNEILWKERAIIDYRILLFTETNEVGFLNKLEIEIDLITNFREGDLINIYNVSNPIISSQPELIGSDTQEGVNIKILKIINEIDGQRIIIDVNSTISSQQDLTAQVRLVYHPLIVYVGEVNGVSNVAEANRSYTEVYAHIPDHTGKTPDVLFRTLDDANYRPNLSFPIIPAQIQPEIMGAEFFSSPIVSSPQDYPGSYFGQFDAQDFTYRTSNGDLIRRSGDYYGLKGDRNNPVIDAVNLDGLGIDFDTSHYVKMNIPNNVLTNFDQFNALEVNNETPRDFEFNAILWYYTVEDTSSGIIKNNLYGISFLNNPDNNPVADENGIRFPTLKKLVTNGRQDGTSYAFNLNLNFNVINDNRNEPYNPQAINSLFSMNLFNDDMVRLASTNDSFLNILSEQQFLREEITNIKSLLYTQTDINVINRKIFNLEQLLKLYSTIQITTSDSIRVDTLSGSPAAISLNSIDPLYNKVENIKTSEMFSTQGILPINITIPENKTFLINVINNDQIDINYDENLSIILETDLSLNQSVDIHIKGDQLSTENKKLDIFINTEIDQSNGTPIISSSLLIGEINLPVFYNKNLQRTNSAYMWSEFKFNIDFTKNITLIDSETLRLSLIELPNIINKSIKSGDILVLNNLLLGANDVFDFSGQYTITTVNGQEISLDIKNNPNFVSNYIDSSFPYNIHTITTSELASLPYFSLNKGINIRIIKVNNIGEFSERYSVIINDLKF